MLNIDSGVVGLFADVRIPALRAYRTPVILDEKMIDLLQG